MNQLAKAEPRIVLAVREQALEALKDEAIGRARMVAGELEGIVVTDAATAARVTDQLAVLKDGQKAAKAILEGLTGPLRRAADTARAAFSEPLRVLEAAEISGKRALDGWDEVQRRKIREEQERMEREAGEALAAQRNAGIEAPPMELPPTPAVAPVHGSHATSYVTTVLRVEVLNIHEVADAWPGALKLDEVAAKKMFRELEQRTGVAFAMPHDYGGLRFTRETVRAVR